MQLNLNIFVKNMVSLNLIRIWLVLISINSIVKSENIQNENKVIEREKRVVGTFPYNSCTGVRTKLNYLIQEDFNSISLCRFW